MWSKVSPFLVTQSILLCLLLLRNTSALNTTCENVQEVSPSSEDGVGNLEDALAMAEEAFQEDCVNITLTPGNYTVNRFFTLHSNNFVLHASNSGAGQVFVTFKVSNDTYDLDLPPYALDFRNVEFVLISGVNFEHSPGIVGFENVTKVVIKDSLFRWFLQGAVDIYQCYCIEIYNSAFEHNGPVFLTRKGAYRGHAGGVSIGYNAYSQEKFNSSSLPDEMGAWIEGCRFLNNTSDPRQNPVLSTGQVLSGGGFTGRGGAMTVAVNSPFEFNVVIKRCEVIDNKARSFGAGIYLVFSGFSPHLSTVNDSLFLNNTSAGSGGLSLGYVEGSVNGQSVRLDVHRCHFENNVGDFGGGMYLYADRITVEDGDPNGYITLVDNCTFVGNSGPECGAAVSVSSQLVFGTNSIIPPAIFNNCYFENNDGGRGGVVTTGYLPLVLRGFNHFHSNQGRVLVIIGTRAEVFDTLLFTDNDGSGRGGSGIDGGALYTSSFSQIVLQEGTNISFVGNNGTFGAALIVNNMATSSLPLSYAHVEYNPLCVLRHVNSRTLPDEWSNVSMRFHNNTARYGASVLISGLDFCAFPDRDRGRVFRWNFVEFSDSINTAHSPSTNDSRWYVETLAVKINITENEVSAYPGEEVIVKFKGFDELGRPTTSSIRLSNDNASLLFTPSVATSEVISIANLSTTFMIQDDVQKERFEVQVESLFTEVPSQVFLNISVLPCPLGYQLESTVLASEEDNETEHRHTEYRCVCALEKNEIIRNCQRETLLLNEGIWAGVQNKDGQPELFAYPCPLQYCRYKCSTKAVSGVLSCVTKFDRKTPNEQCSPEREGVLCGDCHNETGFSALLDKCKECSYINIIYIPVLIFLDIIVIGVLLVIKFGPPAWLYPTLFYVQLVPFLRDGFRINFAPFHPYACYVSSALSFYFLYDFCLFPRLSAVFSYGLRFIPFFVTIAVAVAMVAFRYWNKLTRVPWYGLWWVTLLQYSHVVHTSLAILNCPKLPSPENGTLSYRWYVNGNVECFADGGHIILSVIAVSVLVFCVLLIPLIFIYAQGYAEKPMLLCMSIKPLSEWFKKEYPWWPAMELMRRLLFSLLIIPAIKSYYPIAVYLCVSLTVCSFLRPYKRDLYNYIDIFLTANTLVLIMLRENNATSMFDSVIIVKSYTMYNSHLLPANPALVGVYYVPVAFFILCCVVALLFKFRQCYSKRKQRKELETEDDGTFNFPDVSYQEAGVPQTSNFVATLPRNAVPMSTLVRHLNRQDSRSSTEDVEEGRGSRGRFSHRGTKVTKTIKQHMRKQFSFTNQRFSWSTYRTHIRGKLKKENRDSMDGETTF